LRFLLGRTLSTDGTRIFVFAGILAFLMSVSSFAGACNSTSAIISNNMKLLAGSGDTVCVASLGQQGWGVNYTINKGKTWWGSTLGCFSDYTVGKLAFGGSTMVLLLNAQGKPTKVWYAKIAGDAAQTGNFDIAWSDSVKKDTVAVTEAVGVTYAGGDFYFACMNGGILKWNPSMSSPTGWLPGDSVSFVPSKFSPSLHPSFGKKSFTVSSVDAFGADSGLSIAVTTEQWVWLFSPRKGSWDTSRITTVFDPAAPAFIRYEYSFVNNAVVPPILYATAAIASKQADSLSLFRYHAKDGRWLRVLGNLPSIFTTASRGFIYGVTGKNQPLAYRDSVSDSAPLPAGGLTLALDDKQIYNRLTVQRNIDKPESINDLLFVPVRDSTGHFLVATSSGLFYSDAEVPGISLDTFDFWRRPDKTPQGGLKETYALPGIITNADNPQIANASKALFVYKVNETDSVTIRVYDFNMQLVKTIIDNKRREPTYQGSARSTVPAVDFWDGRTGTGRPVAPGIYYYKITTRKGERSFGKIVVAASSR
jgi:hypothetical protein